MSTVRRTAVLIGLIAAVVIGTGIPASATFSARSAAQPATVATGAVAAPANVSLAGTSCPTTSPTTRVLRVKLSWQKSATQPSATGRTVTGYRISALYGTTEAYSQVVGAGTTSLQADFPVQYASAGIRVTVTTLTDYGWTATSAPVGPISC